MATHSTTAVNFEVDVIQSEIPVLVDFWAPWCPPCSAVAPTLEEISDELEGTLKVIKVDIDQNPELAHRFGVRSIPSLKFFVNGKITKETVGAMPKNVLLAQAGEFI